MIIHWTLHSQIDPEILSQMQIAADACLISEKVMVPCSVAVCLCDDEEIKSLNREYREVDSSTDVLSFPSVAYPYPYTAGDCENLLRAEYDDETGSCFLGDIIISVPHIVEQAREYNHSEKREALFLLVHGICHLMGYDHIEKKDKEKMRAMEERILSSVSADREQSSDPDDRALIDLAKEAMKRSYSPYSSYPVGAALHAKDGRVFLGCNIENASFGLTNCAERTAVFKAVSDGAREFDVIAIAAKTKAWPCGACRQVLNEFAPGIRVIVTWDGNVEEKNLRDLLPESFGPDSM